MRICPRCGYEEHVVWKNLPFCLFTKYCDLDSFRDIEPEISILLEKLGNVIVYPYKYHLSKSNHVHRIAVLDCKNPWSKSVSEPRKEKHRIPHHKLDEYLHF